MVKEGVEDFEDVWGTIIKLQITKYKSQTKHLSKKKTGAECQNYKIELSSLRSKLIGEMEDWEGVLRTFF